MIPNCAATRHAHFTLDGSGPARLEPPDLERLAGRALGAGAGIAPRRPGQGHARRDRDLEAGRDAAAQRQDPDRPRCRAQAHPGPARQGRRPARGRGLHATGSSITSGRWIRCATKSVGPAGPTTATRMDKFTEMMLAKTGLLGMIGKARARPGGDRGDPQAQGGVPDGGRRRGLPGVARPSSHRAWSPLPTSAWKRSTNSK